MNNDLPISPPISESRESSYSLNRISQHHATAQHQQEQYTLDGSDYLPSGSSTSFHSPQPGHRMIDQYGRSYDPAIATFSNPSMAYQTDLYGNHLYQPYQPGAYYVTPPPQDLYSEGYQIASAPTPAPSDPGENRRKSKRSHGRRRSVIDDDYPSSASARGLKPATKARSTPKNDIPKLTAPLSVLAKDMKDVSIIDKESAVNMSADARKQKVIDAKGKIKRPSNSFMLYRSAFANVAKALLGQDNHQVVSSVCGKSWAMEVTEVREHYIELARQERDNHAKAHPNYKFSPMKTPNLKRKRKGVDSDEEDDLSDIDTTDFEWRPQGGRGGHAAKREKTETHPNPWPTIEVQPHSYSSPVVDYTVAAGQYLYLQDQYAHYYHNGSHPEIQVGHVEEMYLHPHTSPRDHIESSQHLIGLPGVDSYNSLEQEPHGTFEGDPSLTTVGHVDPLLMSYQNNVEGDASRAPLSAGLHGLADVQAFNELHHPVKNPEDEDLAFHQD